MSLMLPLDGKHRWMFIAVLLFGLYFQDSISEDCRKPPQKFLFVSPKTKNDLFPNDVVEFNASKLCFQMLPERNAACCNTGAFLCNFTITGGRENYTLILKKEILSNQDIVVITIADHGFPCKPMKDNNTYLDIHNCLKRGVKNIKLTKENFCENMEGYDEDACKGLAETHYIIAVVKNKLSHCRLCKRPDFIKPETSITLTPSPNISTETAAKLMNISLLVKNMGNSSSASIKMGNISGLITRLPKTNPININFVLSNNRDINILKNNNDSGKGYSRSIKIPAEASGMAAKGENPFAAVILFPDMFQDNPDSTFLNNEVVGIEMGKEISNLSDRILIRYKWNETKGRTISCVSWHGKDTEGKKAKWIQDGCHTKENYGSITCECTHLTFFAILMSPPSANMSSSDVKSLTTITSIGCGLSIAFLTVALFMHCLIRKGKASQATKILINLFLALIGLNLSFLLNESIANLENFAACVTVAAVMHYTMLATFTWFFMQALHLYFILWKLPSEVKHYIRKICAAGWVTPAVVVIALVASRQYGFLAITTDDGNSAKMCWISNAVIHQVVNIGYYAVVFIFSFVMFIVTLRHIILAKQAEKKHKDSSSISTNVFSIVGLFFLFGITWGFAFFSYGPMLTASYYIFTILNSFQGFLLAIYYFKTSKIVEDSSLTDTMRSTATSNTIVKPPH
ncbi:adhesion G-protein coupled receptor G2-like isoform X3 [Eleginops maclovinus]|uniref:adhesion G-protein coupled receptor G2-like isoform X3 n=1 Tax=Eleginops maclovinus TaxID=56733 RepID=UPI0030803E2C